MTKHIGVVFIAILLPIFPALSQGLLINELMSSNGQTFSDSDGEYPDWIELYNSSDKAINLKGYTLSDKEGKPDKWALPEMKLQPKSFLVVFLSGKNKKGAKELHSNFKVSSKGENIYLSREGLLIDQLVAKALGEDQAYGRLPDGGSNWWPLEMATPGTSNNESNQIQFSHTPGFYNKGFSLEMTSTDGYELRYTLDGTIPDSTSPLYEEPLPIRTDRATNNALSLVRTCKEEIWEKPKGAIHKHTTLRCAGFYKKERRTKVYTQTYFIDGFMARGYHLPVVSLVTDSLNLFQHDTGIYVPGAHFKSDNPDWSGNFYQGGPEWERSVHIEYFENNGILGFSQDAGMRIHGGRTRHYPQKTLRMYARSEYGTKKFSYPLTPQKDENDYKRFLMRTTMGSWNGHTVFKDAFLHQTVRNMDLEYQDYRPVVVFINGEYWGLHTIRDRIDTRFLEYTTGVPEDSIDLIQGNYKLVSAGTNTHYVAMLNFIDSNDLAIDSNYQYITTQMDLSNYIDYQIAEIFFANKDWPSNNVKMWRPQRKGGKWRWIFYDLDASCGNFEYNMFEHSTLNDPDVSYPNNPRSTFLFRNLLRNQEFKRQFIVRFAEVLEEHLTVPEMSRLFYEAKELYEPEMGRHIDRWHIPASRDRWEEVLGQTLLPFIRERPCVIEAQIKEFFDLDSFHFTCESAPKHDMAIGLFPNPTSAQVHINNNSAHAFSGHCEVFSLSGRKVIEDPFVIIEGFSHYTLNSADLEQGAYLVVLTDAQQVITRKLLVVEQPD